MGSRRKATTIEGIKVIAKLCVDKSGRLELGVCILGRVDDFDLRCFDSIHTCKPLLLFR